MTLLRMFRSLWLAAALLLAGATTHASPRPATVAATAAAATAAAAPPNATPLSHGRFRDFLVYRPAGAPSSFVLMLSGEEGWTPTADALARQLALDGAMVAGIDWAKFKANLESDADQCVFPDGDLENLSHFVQAYFRNSTYLSPVLVGTSSGAAMAYAALAQAPRNTFAAAVTLGFCPSFNLQKPLCRGSGLEFTRSTRGRGVDLLPVKNLARS